MNILDKAIGAVNAAISDISDHAKALAEENAAREKARAESKKEAERIEAERKAEEDHRIAIQQKEAMQADISKYKAEAAEYGLTLCEYLAYRSYITLSDLELKVNMLMKDAKSIKSTASIANMNSSVAAMNSQIAKLSK